MTVATSVEVRNRRFAWSLAEENEDFFHPLRVKERNPKLFAKHFSRFDFLEVENHFAAEELALVSVEGGEEDEEEEGSRTRARATKQFGLTDMLLRKYDADRQQYFNEGLLKREVEEVEEEEEEDETENELATLSITQQEEEEQEELEAALTILEARRNLLVEARLIFLQGGEVILSSEDTTEMFDYSKIDTLDSLDFQERRRDEEEAYFDLEVEEEEEEMGKEGLETNIGETDLTLRERRRKVVHERFSSSTATPPPTTDDLYDY